jgi:fatty acid desaturase
MAAMDDVPRELLQRAYKRKAIYLLKVPFHFGVWAACGYLIWQTQSHPWGIPIGIACSLLITNLVRGLGAVGHDAVHGTVFKDKTAAYLIGLLCWFPTGMSYTLYGNYHLHHHRIANTYPDVDNFVVTDYTKNPVLAKLLMLAIYSFAYPIYFMFQIARYIPRLSTGKRIRMNLELATWFGSMGAALYFLPLHFFFFVYGLPFILSAMLASVAQLVEHFGKEPGDDAYSSRTYATKSPVLAFLWNNVSYHNEHHKFPGIPWYNLKWFHREAYPYYDEKVKTECCHEGFLGVALRLYGEILRLDISKIDAKYAELDRDQERQKQMQLAGIAPAEA